MNACGVVHSFLMLSLLLWSAFVSCRLMKAIEYNDPLILNLKELETDRLWLKMRTRYAEEEIKFRLIRPDEDCLRNASAKTESFSFSFTPDARCWLTMAFTRDGFSPRPKITIGMRTDIEVRIYRDAETLLTRVELTNGNADEAFDMLEGHLCDLHMRQTRIDQLHFYEMFFLRPHGMRCAAKASWFADRPPAVHWNTLATGNHTASCHNAIYPEHLAHGWLLLKYVPWNVFGLCVLILFLIIGGLSQLLIHYFKVVKRHLLAWIAKWKAKAEAAAEEKNKTNFFKFLALTNTFTIRSKPKSEPKIN